MLKQIIDPQTDSNSGCNAEASETKEPGAGKLHAGFCTGGAG